MSENAKRNTARSPLKVGIVGIGRATLFDHLPEMEKLPDQFRIVAFCDLLKERRDIVEKKYPYAKYYRRIEDMLDDPDIDMYDIALPSIDHVQNAIECLKHDKWTLLESPIALSHEKATMLRAAAVKARDRLIPYTPGIFAPEFRTALKASEDPRLGEIYEIKYRRQDFIRRDDWQTVKRRGGGAAWYFGTDALLQTIALMRNPPNQLWSDMQRIASVGDAEDYVRICLKSANGISADIEINGGQLPPFDPMFTIRGSRGSFSIERGSGEGKLHIIDPDYKFARRRSSVRTPDLIDKHEPIPVIDVPFAAPDNGGSGKTAFWNAVYDTVRTAQPFPVKLDDVVEIIRYLQIARQSTKFA